MTFQWPLSDLLMSFWCPFGYLFDDFSKTFKDFSNFYALRNSDILRESLPPTMCHMWHMSCVRCQVSGVRYKVSIFNGFLAEDDQTCSNWFLFILQTAKTSTKKYVLCKNSNELRNHSFKNSHLITCVMTIGKKEGETKPSTLLLTWSLRRLSAAAEFWLVASRLAHTMLPTWSFGELVDC